MSQARGRARLRGVRSQTVGSLCAPGRFRGPADGRSTRGVVGSPRYQPGRLGGATRRVEAPGKLRESRRSDRMGRNGSECRAGLEREGAASSLQRTGEGCRGLVRRTEATGPAAGGTATARAEGSRSNVRGPAGRSVGSERRVRRRTGRASDRPIVPMRRVTAAEGRGLTLGMLVGYAREAGQDALPDTQNTALTRCGRLGTPDHASERFLTTRLRAETAIHRR